jgi:hypothetical protein
MGYASGLIRGATGLTPLTRENEAEAEAEGDSKSPTTVIGYATNPGSSLLSG